MKSSYGWTRGRCEPGKDQAAIARAIRHALSRPVAGPEIPAPARPPLRRTRVTVQEIAPPWVDTDRIKKSGDPRAIPLDAFIAETLAGLAREAEDVVVEAVRPVRDNPGANDHAMINAFNASLEADPIGGRGRGRSGASLRPVRLRPAPVPLPAHAAPG